MTISRVLVVCYSMFGVRIRYWLSCITLLAFAPPILSQTIIPGSTLTFRSSGSGSGDWKLSENGYVGTYFSLAAPGSVTLTVNASGSTDDALLPHMNVVV